MSGWVVDGRLNRWREEGEKEESRGIYNFWKKSQNEVKTVTHKKWAEL